MLRARTRPRIERHLTTIFDDPAFADLRLTFVHPMYPFSMRFDVHKNIVSQSPFLKDILSNLNELHNHTTIYVYDKDSNSSNRNNNNESNSSRKIESKVLTIDLAGALLNCGFVLTPFQHIIRRKWQRPVSSSATTPATSSSSLSLTSGATTPTTTTSATTTGVQSSGGRTVKPLAYHILSSHIRFALRWMYTYNRQELVQTLDQEDTLRVLAMAVLFGLDDLATACVEKYIEEQLSMLTIIRDLEHICQLPRNHHAYLQLRDAALLLLLRHGADEPELLSELPVDYMADVLNADMLFVGCEYDRYCLIREVLSLFMRSVGEITWTKNGPVDQDRKRLSGFVKPKPVTASDIRSRKRKRIPSNELMPDYVSPHRANKLARLSFSATVPFKSLAEDASSGGVIDKATVLSYLLKTTVNYSNMTFEQLTKVRQDGIVDDEIVFRAFWQREAFERLLRDDKNGVDNEDVVDDDEASDERHAALNDFFDVSDSDDRRRQMLLGIPKYRFCTTMELSSPSIENGWIRDECVSSNESNEEERGDDDNDSSCDAAKEDHSYPKEIPENHYDDNEQEEEEIVNFDEDEDDEETGDQKVGELAVAVSPPSPSRRLSTQKTPLSSNIATQSQEQTNRDELHDKQHVIWRKTFYSQPEAIWDATYRVRIEAQVIPHHLMVIQEDGDENSYGESSSSLVGDDNKERDSFKEDQVLVCRFELQRMLPSSNDGSFSVTSTDQFHKIITSVLSRRSTASEMFSSQPASSVLKQVAVPTAATQPNMPQRRCSAPCQFTSSGVSRQPHIRYTIHCLNQWEGLIENQRVDPEDRVFVAVTDMKEDENNVQTGYVGQVRLDGCDLRGSTSVDTVVCLEVHVV